MMSPGGRNQRGKSRPCLAAGRTKGRKGLEERSLVDVVGDVADKDGFLGLGAFFH